MDSETFTTTDENAATERINESYLLECDQSLSYIGKCDYFL